ATETKVEVGYLRLRKFKGLSVAFPCVFIDEWSAGIRQAQNFCRLVKRLTRSVVKCLSEQYHIEIVADQHQLGVPARHRQAKEGKLGYRLLDEVRQNVGLHMVYFNQRDVLG